MNKTLSGFITNTVLGLFFLLALCGQAGAQTAGTDSFTMVHANVIDGVSNAPVMDATVVVVNGHIQSIGHEAAPSRGTVIDPKGHWLLPGFVDAHVHVGDLAAARRALRSGATTVGEAG